MKKFDHLWLGTGVGLVAPAVVLYVIFQMGNLMEYAWDFEAYLINIKYTVVLFKPSLLINLAIFMLFINKDYLKFARGIVMSTMLYILLVVATYIFV